MHDSYFRLSKGDRASQLVRELWCHPPDIVPIALSSTRNLRFLGQSRNGSTLLPPSPLDRVPSLIYDNPEVYPGVSLRENRGAVVLLPFASRTGEDDYSASGLPSVARESRNPETAKFGILVM